MATEQEGTQGVGTEENSGTIQIPQDSVHPDQANAPHPTMAQVHQVKVNGETKEATTAQLIEAYQKGTAADERFQQAAQQSKDNAAAITVHADLKAWFGNKDPDAFRRLGEAMGSSNEEIEGALERSLGDDEEGDKDVVAEYDKEIASRGTTQPHSDNSGPIDYSRLSPDIQRVLREAEQTRMAGITQKALDKDEFISYNMKRLSPEGQKAMRQYVDEKVDGRLAQNRGDFGDGTQILPGVLQEVKTHMEALGTPGAQNPMGLGRSPGGGDSEIYPKQKPDHVSSSEGDAFEQNILETLAFHNSRAGQGG